MTILKPLNYLLLSYFLVCILSASTAVAENSSFSPYVDDQGNISFPTNFRSKMVHIGSWFIPKGDASGFHEVYTEQSSIIGYRKTGKFPDGTTLVKEIRAHTTGDYTTGKNIKHATEIKQWFVMIKDNQNRFKNNLIWGNGWGWALFKANAPSTNIARDYKNDCLHCHMPAKKSDWIYVEGLPYLTTP